MDFTGTDTPVLAEPVQASRSKAAKPNKTAKSPKKRTWPSFRPSSWVKVRRHAAGDTNGNRPSMTSTKANATQRLSAVTVQASVAQSGAGGQRHLPLPPATALLRMALKKSDEGSTTITSDLLAKLAL